MTTNDMVELPKTTVFNKVKAAIRYIENLLLLFCCIVFFALMVLNVSDVVGRLLFNKPIFGTSEISAIMMVAIIVLGWAYTQRENAHVKAEFLIQKFPAKVQGVLRIVTLALSLIIFAIITKQAWDIGIASFGEAGRHFQMLNIPKAPFLLLVPAGGIFICLELVIQIVETSLGIKSNTNPL